MESVRVVIAEDESIIRLDLKETLEAAGYEVLADTGRGDTAVELVVKHKPDLVILDIKMPGLSGIEAARRITAAQNTAILILTAYSQRELIEEAIEAGVIAYLVKPFQQSDLVPAIEIAIKRHNEIRALTDQTKNLEEQLESRKVIEKAKGAISDASGVSESEAFRFLQTTAMSDRQTMLEVANRVLFEGLKP